VAVKAERLFLFMEATITAIKQQKRNPQRVSIYLDGVYAFPVAKIVAAWLKVGQQLSQDKINELQGLDEIEKGFQRALNFLSYRPRSQAEVEKNLRKHEVAEDLISQIIDRLKRGNLLNDTDFARKWVDDRATFRPKGVYALRSELRQKGLAETTIEDALAGINEPALAREAAQRKISRWSQLEWQEFRTKLSSFLSRRGFGYETVAEVCREMWQELKQESRQYEQ
jgi:regulatory protein